MGTFFYCLTWLSVDFSLLSSTVACVVLFALYFILSLSLCLTNFPLKLYWNLSVYYRQCIAVTKVTSEMFMVNAHCNSLAIDFDSILNGMKWFIKPSAVISS